MYASYLCFTLEVWKQSVTLQPFTDIQGSLKHTATGTVLSVKLAPPEVLVVVIGAAQRNVVLP